jgi:hypothetical protein
MTTQEKIEQLALAALRSGPPPAAAPKPSTYMAPFDRPKTVALVEGAKTPAPVSGTEAPVLSQSEAPALSFRHESDPELRGEIDARDARIRKQQSRRSWVVTLGLVAGVAAVAGWLAVSPSARAGLSGIVPALNESVEDVKMIGSLTSRYDQQLEKIAVRGDQIGDATRSLGADPDALAEGVDPSMEAEMEQMMGGEGVTSVDRDKAFKEKFGIVGKLAGGKEKPVSAPAAVVDQP